MRRLFASMISILLGVSACGSPEQQAVRSAYNNLAECLEAGDYPSVFNSMSSDTRQFLDELAEALDYYGIGAGENGTELLSTLMQEVEMSGLSREIRSVTISGDSAVVVTATVDGDETTTFVLENGVWLLDFEGFMKESINAGMEGSGMTIEGILTHEYPVAGSQSSLIGGVDVERGDGSCSLRITNGLVNWDILYVFVSPAGDSEWGADWLGTEHVLSPGNTITVRLAPGTYDMMVEDEDEDTYSRYGITVPASGFAWNVTLSDMD